MNSRDYTTAIVTDKTPAEVFAAINNVRGWWSESIEGSTDQLNSIFYYHYQDVHRCTMKITELIPGKKVAWQVLDNIFSFTSDRNEWKGNTLIFELSEQDGRTQVRFTQHGLVPEYECYDICENAWNTYIQKSLYSLIDAGKGHPNGKDKPQTDDEKRLTDFTTTFFTDKDPETVFHAVTNVRGWWQGIIEGDTEKPGDEFIYRMEDVHFSKQRIVEALPGKKVVWLVTDSQLSFLEDKSEWTGTEITFEISEINNKTQLRFTHRGLTSGIECYDACSNGWSKLIQESLFSLVTTGQGKNVF